jgi:hypothetical protein
VKYFHLGHTEWRFIRRAREVQRKCKDAKSPKPFSSPSLSFYEKGEMMSRASKYLEIMLF